MIAEIENDFLFCFLKVTNLPEIKRFKRNKIESKRDAKSIWLPVDEGLRRVRENPGFVYVFEAFSGYGLVEKTYTAQEICDLNEILFRPEQALYTHLPRYSSYTEIIKLKWVLSFHTNEIILIRKKKKTFFLQANTNLGIGCLSPLLSSLGQDPLKLLFIQQLSSASGLGIHCSSVHNVGGILYFRSDHNAVGDLVVQI